MKKLFASMLASIRTFPRRLRHIVKHQNWIVEDEDTGNLWCTLCKEFLTGEDSWKN